MTLFQCVGIVGGASYDFSARSYTRSTNLMGQPSCPSRRLLWRHGTWGAIKALFR